MTNLEKQLIENTSNAVDLFSKFSEAELGTLLKLAGIVPINGKNSRLIQVIELWFGIGHKAPFYPELVKLLKAST